MANRDAPMGMRALRNRNGSHPPVRQYDAVTSVIAEGELVLLSTTGLAYPIGAGYLASAADNILGVAAAVKSLKTATQVSAGQSKVQVYVDPDQLYVLQSDDATLATITNYVGRNFALTNADNFNSTTGQSIAELDGSTGSVSAAVGSDARPIQVVELHKAIGNAANVSGTGISWADFVVRITPRYHFFAGSLGV